MTNLYEYLLDGPHDAVERELSQLFAGHFIAPVVSALTELGIPGLLAGQALTADQIASSAATDPDATGRLLRAGLAVRLLDIDPGGRYTLTQMGERLRPDVSALGDISGYFSAPVAMALAGLADQVRTGRKVDPAVPGGFWDYISEHPADVARFSRAMGYVTSRLLTALDEAGYQPPSASRLVDVGGSRGTLLGWLLRALPSATGVVYDRQESLSADYLAAAGVGDRASVAPGSFLAAVPAGDLHVLSHVLHNWDDENVRRIVANCARASSAGGWLVVIENVIPSPAEPAFGQLLDMMMMVVFGGRERTAAELQALIEPAGYSLARSVPLAAGTSDQAPPWRVLEFQRDALPVRGPAQPG